MSELSETWNGIQAAALLQLYQTRHQLELANRELAAKDERINRLEEQVLRDPLTGLMNRRGLDDFFEQEQARLARNASPGAIFVLIDLDRFKFINDTYGHQAGDAVLKEISDTLHATTRRLDCPARLGGDEFVIVLSQIDPAQAEKKLENLRQILDRMSIDFDGQKINFGASVGGALIKADSTYEDVYKRADGDLYMNKEKRRNAVPEAHSENIHRLVPVLREAFHWAARHSPIVRRAPLRRLITATAPKAR